MQPRIEYAEVAPAGMAAMLGLKNLCPPKWFRSRSPRLVKLRASQINGCAYCLDMHTKDARARGESEQRLYAVVVRRETPFFSEPERAALAWAEAVTLVNCQQVPDEVYDLARQRFSEKELVDLTLAIVAINRWNRLAISFRRVPGTHQPKRQSEGTAKRSNSDGAMEKAAKKAAGANTTEGERT